MPKKRIIVNVADVPQGQVRPMINDKPQPHGQRRMIEMKTTAQQKKLNVIKWRENHHRALETLRAPECKLTGLQLWRKLVKIERLASHAATQYCNGDIEQDDFDVEKEKATVAVRKTFGQIPPGFFVNGDPRGYALKLDDEKTTIPEGMHRDMGGYGILAAMIGEDL